MSILGQSLISLSSLSQAQIINLFEKAESLRSKPVPSVSGTAALVFFENSTRTKLSFESACIRSGLYPICLDATSGSSLSKGESAEDTILNVAAMQPEVLIVRSGDSLPVLDLKKQVTCPWINAGWGVKGHPTQALLDIYTIWKERSLKGLKLLILGDVVHSRVASSHFEALEKMGVELALCGPEEMRPEPQQLYPGAKLPLWFADISKALEWADVAMALRVQFERHSAQMKLDIEEYHESYGLTERNLKYLSPNALIMHPGPVNRGVEISQLAFADPRSRILQQVTNGVFLRTALIHSILGRL